MLIKINGTPWEDIHTPDISTYTPFDFSSHPYASIQTVHDIVNTTVVGLDQFNYYVMSKTPVTEEIYKMTGWATDTYVHYCAKVWGSLLGLN